MSRNAFERQKRGERVRSARISQALERERDGAEVRIRGLAGKLLRERVDACERRLGPAASERDEIGVDEAHAASELVHALVVPALVPFRRRGELLLQRLASRRIAEESEHMRVDELRLLAFRRGVCAAQERKRARRVAENL